MLGITNPDEYIEKLLALNKKRRQSPSAGIGGRRQLKQSLDLTGTVGSYQKISSSTPFFDAVLDK